MYNYHKMQFYRPKSFFIQTDIQRILTWILPFFAVFHWLGRYIFWRLKKTFIRLESDIGQKVMRLDDRETRDVNELYAAEINRVCILRVSQLTLCQNSWHIKISYRAERTVLLDREVSAE